MSDVILIFFIYEIKYTIEIDDNRETLLCYQLSSFGKYISSGYFAAIYLSKYLYLIFKV